MQFKARQIGLVLVLALVVATGGVFARATSDRGARSQKVERSLAADSSVTVSICVMSGNISVQGWDKDEVLARSADAAQIELRGNQAPAQSGKARKIEVFVVDNSDEEKIKKNCQAYSDLELFVPQAASVHVQTRDGNIEIADIAVAVAGTQNGDISIERVSRAVEVGSVGGSVSIKDSTGRASVNTIGGGVEAINLRPVVAGDGFEAVSVSGDLNLEGVSHSQFTARTVTGNVHLTGPLATGGHYGFKTMSGDITLTMPDDSSFRLSAKVSNDGEIISDFPLTLIPDVAPPAAPVSAPHPAPHLNGVPPTGPTPPPAAMPNPPELDDVPPTSSTPVQPSRSTDTLVSGASSKSATPSPVVIVKVSPRITAEPRINKIIVSTPVFVSSPTLRRVDAVCGGGDASIQVASFSGTLNLLKN